MEENLESKYVSEKEDELANKKICSIYLGNLPWKASPEEIASLLTAKTGVRVKDVRIVKEKGTGRSRGFAFVDVYYESSDLFISEAPELTLAGRTLTIKYANERAQAENNEYLSPVSFEQKATQLDNAYSY